jgi:hypothetical protein
LHSLYIGRLCYRRSPNFALSVIDPNTFSNQKSPIKTINCQGS